MYTARRGARPATPLGDPCNIAHWFEAEPRSVLEVLEPTMILRDPVHGLVAFEGRAEQVVERLLATREVQRLRNVRQLGLTSLVFPGAEHSRFAHSLGAAHVMARLLSRVRAMQSVLPPELRLDDESEADALAATLLHDLGHGPFSHLFEDVVPHARRHEAWTMDVVLDSSTDVHRALRSFSAQMPERVAALIDGDHRLGYLGRSVSGTLDADRCDYLLRDSHMTGVGYGVYDLDWLLQALAFGVLPESGEWVLAIEGRKGLPPIEGFFLARQFMYQQVYHHKATRAAEALIRAIFIRVAELVRSSSPALQIPAALRNAAVGDPVGLGDYLALDDVQLLSSFRTWETCSDSILAELTTSLARRDLPKTVPLKPDGAGVWQEALLRAREVASRRGLRPDLAVRLDVPSDIPYEEPDDASAEGLWVLIRHQPIQRLGRCSFLLGQLRNQRIERPRLIFPSSVRDEVLAAIEGVID
jgi:HD superfamily phosphohydrolase